MKLFKNRKNCPVSECVCVCVCALSYIQLFLTPRTVACQLLCPSNFPDKNTGAGCHFLLQGIFLTQGSNWHLLFWQADSLPPGNLGDLLMLNARDLEFNKRVPALKELTL